ncbi:MAG: ATP cone domain-containing protein [Candidatus Aenigmatarchaeota archaeon]
MYVIKASGEREEFDKEKIIRTIKRAGLSERNARSIANMIEKKTRDGDTTNKIYHMIIKELDKTDEPVSIIYRLREAITALDPKIFERYTKKIFEAYGYQCRLDEIVDGKLVGHEIDVIARKEKTIMVECKHHTNPHRFAALGVIMSLWAKLDDIQKGYPKTTKYKFDSAYLVTNTKLSEHAIRYAKGKNISYSAWKSGSEQSLDGMVSKKKLYPITILKINNKEKATLLRNDIITIQDLLTAPSLPIKNLDSLRQAHELMS